MTYALSIMMNLKKVTMILILMCWKWRKKMKILVNPRLWIFQQKSMIENLQLSCLIKEMEMYLTFISVHPYFDSNIPCNIFYVSIGSQILCIARTRTDLVDLTTHVSLLLMRIKKQRSVCTRIILLLKNIIQTFEGKIF